MKYLYVMSIETNIAHWTIGVIMGHEYDKDIYQFAVSVYPHLRNAQYKFLFVTPLSNNYANRVVFIN